MNTYYPFLLYVCKKIRLTQVMIVVVTIFFNAAIVRGDTINILTWIKYADISDGGEYKNAKRAISSYFPDYIESSTVTIDPAQLERELIGKNVFLIPEQELYWYAGYNLESIAASFSTVLNNFVSKGGVIIVCTWYQNEPAFLTNTGLLSITRVGSPGYTVLYPTTSHDLTKGVPSSFRGDYIGTFTTTNGQIIVRDATGAGAVITRDVGAGKAILVASDFYTLAPGMERVLANATQQAHHHFWSEGGNNIFLESGNVGIGTKNPKEKLSVNGTVLAKEVKVSSDSIDWPDYVFEDSYDLPSLERVESFIVKNKHLPDVPSAKEVHENGLTVSEMFARQIRKIEELTLYLIELKKDNTAIRKQNDELLLRLRDQKEF